MKYKFNKVNTYHTCCYSILGNTFSFLANTRLINNTFFVSRFPNKLQAMGDTLTIPLINNRTTEHAIK